MEICPNYGFHRFYNITIESNTALTNSRVHEIAYGFGGPSEKNVSPH